MIETLDTSAGTITVTLPHPQSEDAKNGFYIKRTGEKEVIIETAEGDEKFELKKGFTTFTRKKRKWFQFWKPKYYWRYHD